MCRGLRWSLLGSWFPPSQSSSSRPNFWWLSSFCFQYYKCQFQVGLSWLAFFVPPEVISGRMVLLITLLLMLTHLGELLLPCNAGSGDDCGTNSQPGLMSPYQELLLRPRVLLTAPSLQLTSGWSHVRYNRHHCNVKNAKQGCWAVLTSSFLAGHNSYHLVLADPDHC